MTDSIVDKILEEIYYFGEDPQSDRDQWLLNIYGYKGRLLNRRANLYFYLKQQFQEKYPNTNWKKLTRGMEAKRRSVPCWEFLSPGMQAELEDRYYNQF